MKKLAECLCKYLHRFMLVVIMNIQTSHGLSKLKRLYSDLIQTCWMFKNMLFTWFLKEYMRLAAALWLGTEPMNAVPMKDRDIFDLLGFD